MGFVTVVDDLFGKVDIEYSVNKIRSYEKFSIYIDGDLKRNNFISINFLFSESE